VVSRYDSAFGKDVRVKRTLHLVRLRRHLDNLEHHRRRGHHGRRFHRPTSGEDEEDEHVGIGCNRGGLTLGVGCLTRGRCMHCE